MNVSGNNQHTEMLSKKDAVNHLEVQNSAEDDPGSKPHPLMMSVVLRCVFDKIRKIEDLTSCRLVNSIWNEAAIYGLNKLCGPVIICNPNTLESLKSCIVASNSDNNRWRFPFTKFYIVPLTPKISLEGFLSITARWVTDINLVCNMHIYPESSVLSKTSFLYNLEFPSLKSLKVCLHIPLRSYAYKHRPEFVRLRLRQICLSFVSQIIEKSTNLEQLHLGEVDKYENYQIKEYEPMLNQMLDTIETKFTGKLRVLKINAAVENLHLKRLTDLKLSLTKLHLDFDYTKQEMINPKILRDFLQSQSETLVKLKLKNLGQFRIKNVLFPTKLEKLKTIEIGINSSDNDQKTVTFPGLNINKQMSRPHRNHFYAL